MSSRHWLIKEEPESYSWSDLVRDQRTEWTGIRNFQARNNLRAMQVGDQVLFYHTGKEKAVVGIAQVIRGAYADPSAKEEQWVAVDIKPVRKLDQPVTLAAMREEKDLAHLALIRQSRLSVVPLTPDEFSVIVRMGSKDGGK